MTKSTDENEIPNNTRTLLAQRAKQSNERSDGLAHKPGYPATCDTALCCSPAFFRVIAPVPPPTLRALGPAAPELGSGGPREVQFRDENFGMGPHITTNDQRAKAATL